MKKTQVSSDPFSFLSRTELWVTGGWDRGGFARIVAEDRKHVLKTPQALFAVLALLILAARRASGSAGSFGKGFLTVAELRAQIKQVTGGTLDPDPEHVNRYVFRLRGLFGQGARSTAAGRRWAKRLLQHLSPLGYRLSLPADKLHLQMLEEDSPLVPAILQPDQYE
jgi:hypothetical protein